MRVKPFVFGCISLLAIINAMQQPERVEQVHREVAPTAAAATQEPSAENRDPQQLDPAEVELIGRTIWGEADGVKSEAERAAVAWCILNRVETYGETIEEVVTAPNQFQGYRTGGKCPQRHLDLAADVLVRWYAEQDGASEVGRVLPTEYLYFVGDGERNHFSIEWQSGEYWGWTLDNPYITEN